MATQFLYQARGAFFADLCPDFPIETHLLHALRPEPNWDGDTLDRLGAQIPGFQGLSAITTTDGYTWHVAMRFEIRGLLCYVAFPAMQNNCPDRSIAVYADYGVTEKEKVVILDGLVKALIDERQTHTH